MNSTTTNFVAHYCLGFVSWATKHKKGGMLKCTHWGSFEYILKPLSAKIRSSGSIDAKVLELSTIATCEVVRT